MVEWLEKWYKKQCDGDWEHMFGVQIYTLDNPGWRVKIDIADTELEEKYNKLEKSYNDIETRNIELTNNIKTKNLEVEMVSQGFKKEDLDEVIKLRNSIYQDEEDDSKAISQIKERYGATFFPKIETEVEKKIEIPEESKFVQPVKKAVDLDVSRKTNIRDIVIK